MSLKHVFNTMKREGYVVKELDRYLLSLNKEGNDRAIDINAPSSAGGCLRASYYARKQYERDTNAVDPRTRRIFNNGDGVHDRLQGYLEEMGMLLMPEVPLRNNEYNIQGHTDGFLKLSNNEIGILEIKSINDRGFSGLKDAREDHKYQAMIYLYCAEERRRELQDLYPTMKDYEDSLEDRRAEYRTYYTHLIDGNKYTREEKLAKKVLDHEKADNILYETMLPVGKVIFIYENKNTQEIKEYCVKRDDDILDPILESYVYLNQCVKTNIIPPREGTNKSTDPCRWCNYKLECYN